MNKLCISKLMRHSVCFKFTENARLQLQALKTFLGIISKLFISFQNPIYTSNFFQMKPIVISDQEFSNLDCKRKLLSRSHFEMLCNHGYP